MMQTESTARCGSAAGPAALDWQALLAEHDRWLRTVVYARVGEPQAVDEVMQEVAQRLGITQSAVQARLHRARSRLRGQLAALEVVENEL